MKEMKFNLPSVDPNKFYTFYVKSKVDINCGSTKLWSELAGPVYWGTNVTSEGMEDLGSFAAATAHLIPPNTKVD